MAETIKDLKEKIADLEAKQAESASQIESLKTDLANAINEADDLKYLLATTEAESKAKDQTIARLLEGVSQTVSSIQIGPDAPTPIPDDVIEVNGQKVQALKPRFSHNGKLWLTAEAMFEPDVINAVLQVEGQTIFKILV